MTFLRTFLATALLGLTLCVSPVYAAAPPSIESVQQTLDKLPDRKLPDADMKALQNVLQQTLTLLGNKQDYEQRLTDLKQQLEGAPRQTTKTSANWPASKASKVVPVAQRYASLPVPQLEQLLASAPPSRATCKKPWPRQQPEHRRPDPPRARPGRNQQEPDAHPADQWHPQGRQATMASCSPPTSATSSMPNWRRSPRLIPLRRQELAGNSQLQDLGGSQHDLLLEKTARQDQEIQDLQTLINQKRLAQSQETVTEQSIEAQKAGSSSLLATESAANLKLSDYLLRSTDRSTKLTQQNLETKQLLDNVTQSDSGPGRADQRAQGQPAAVENSLSTETGLPRLQKMDKNLADEIANIRLYQFEVNQQRELISNPSAYVDNLLATQPADQVTPQLRKTLLELVVTRSDLLERLNRELSALLNESITLQLNQKQLLSTAAEPARDARRADVLDPQQQAAGRGMAGNRPAPAWKKQLNTLPWGSSLSELYDGLTQRPLLFCPCCC
jgi:potassium-dependent mechanosensitive channel